MSEQLRGQLTQRIKDKSETLLGYQIDTTELRLMAYVQYVMVNSQKIGIEKINQEEREILKKWKKDGHLEGGACGLSITKEFWDYICELIFLGYVDLKGV